MYDLLQACTDEILDFLVLACGPTNFCIISFIKTSGFYVLVLSSERAMAGCPTVLFPAKNSHGKVLEISMEDSLERADNGSPSYTNQDTKDLMSLQQDLEAQGAFQIDQEAMDREQDFKDRELMEALESERETLAALCRELEQERNSSATAASEALAMISRLQEEKAAVQLEARQFQRMVIEKVLYDQEAIEVLQEIIVKREEEKISLEEEIRVCREKLDNVLMEERDDVERNRRHSFSFPELDAKGKAIQIFEPEMSIEPVKIGATPKVIKEAQRRSLERLRKSSNQILTSEIPLEGMREPISSINVEESAVIGNEVCKPKLKMSLKGVTIEEDKKESALQLHSLRKSCENSLPVSVGGVRQQIGKLVVRNDEKAEETEFISLKRRWSARSSQDGPLDALDKVKEDRRNEEKRLSVLEYVWKFEEQLQQQGGKPPIQVTRPKNGGESRSITQSPVQGDLSTMTSGEGEASVKELTRDDSLRRRLFGEGDSMEQGLAEKSYVEEEEVELRDYNLDSKFPGVNDSKVEEEEEEEAEEEEAYRAYMENSQECPSEAVYVQDVYEVQNSMYEGPAYVNEGVSKSRDSSVEEMHELFSDRLGKPDFLNLEEEDTVNMDEPDVDCPSQTAVSSQDVEDCKPEWEDLEGKVRYKELRLSSSLRRRNSKTLVEEEVEQLTQRLMALEADRYLMKQRIESLKRENGEMKLLQEIAQQLRELRIMEKKESRLKNAPPPALQFQVLNVVWLLQIMRNFL